MLHECLNLYIFFIFHDLILCSGIHRQKRKLWKKKINTLFLSYFPPKNRLPCVQNCAVVSPPWSSEWPTRRQSCPKWSTGGFRPESVFVCLPTTAHLKSLRFIHLCAIWLFSEVEFVPAKTARKLSLPCKRTIQAFTSNEVTIIIKCHVFNVYTSKSLLSTCMQTFTFNIILNIWHPLWGTAMMPEVFEIRLKVKVCMLEEREDFEVYTSENTALYNIMVTLLYVNAWTVRLQGKESFLAILAKRNFTSKKGHTAHKRVKTQTLWCVVDCRQTMIGLGRKPPCHLVSPGSSGIGRSDDQGGETIAEFRTPLVSEIFFCNFTYTIKVYLNSSLQKPA